MAARTDLDDMELEVHDQGLVVEQLWATLEGYVNKDQKTRLIYLGAQQEAKAREYSANYKRLLEIVEEMTALNMQLLKEDACP